MPALADPDQYHRRRPAHRKDLARHRPHVRLGPPANTLANHFAGGLALHRHGLRIELVHRFYLGHDRRDDRRQQRLGFFILDEERSMNSGNMYAGISGRGSWLYAQSAVLGVEARAMRWRRGMTARESA